MLEKSRMIIVNFLLWARLVAMLSFVSWLPFLFVTRIDGGKDFFSNTNFPLKELQNIIVDADDHVFVGVAGFGRVQVYDTSGRFLYGFFAISAGGRTRLGFDADRNVLVAMGRSDTLYTYTKHGRLLATNSGSRDVRQRWDQDPPWNIDSDGRRYVVRDRNIDPKVVRITPNGDEETFLVTAFYLWPFVAGSSCIITICVTSLILRFLKLAKPAE